MTLLTALELAGNYPENISISAAKQENGMYSSFCYMKRKGEIHKLMLSTNPVFKTAKEAKDTLHAIAKNCKKEYGN